MAPSLIAILLAVGQAVQTPPPTGSSRPWAIVDNSFLVEEAFNQDPKVVQNIFNWTRTQDSWQFTFTQEWPVPGVRHQLSYTLPRHQHREHAGASGTRWSTIGCRSSKKGRDGLHSRLASARFCPSGSRSVGAHQGGLQVNLPFSKQDKDFYFHWNAGFTWVPRESRDDLLSPSLAGSAIYRVADMVNVMLEAVFAENDSDQPNGTTRFTARR